MSVKWDLCWQMLMGSKRDWGLVTGDWEIRKFMNKKPVNEKILNPQSLIPNP